MAVTDSASSITVAVRVRPFTIREAAQLVKSEDGPVFLGDGSLAAAPAPKLSQKGLRPIIKVVDDRCLVFDPPEDNPVQKFSRSVVPQGKRVKDQTFMFDRVFDENTTQSDVYEATTRNLLDSVLDGYNATVFAYGATGCGKTHTITGTAQQPGIIFLTMQELFEKINELSEEKVIEISLSYLEIYNETIRDLLIPGGTKQTLTLREDSNQTVSVAGLSSHHPKNVQEVMDMIVCGNENRTMSPTEANATSSRSHAVLQINIAQKERNADMNEPHTLATLSIIDLAGSERASATKNRGERLLEGANINKSLLALGSCINALCDPRIRNHVPYRNSKLTRLLKFSLGGNCRTVMIVCVSPSSAHFDETQNTLRYANRAKNIQTKVTRNVYNVNRHVKDFLKKIDEQMTLINELKQQQKDHEATAFAKFKKQMEKKESIGREGIARIRAAYDHSAAERQERITMMKKLRQIERRISLISSWVAGFDTVCEQREEEEPPKALVAMRKTAQGILAELESSRQHYHQRLSKASWDRALETALQTGLRQLKEAEGATEATELSSLIREAELLRSMADREAYTQLLDLDKGGDAAMVQVLLQAHFDTIAILGQILQMTEDEAVLAAKKLLGQIVAACSTATSQIIKPDGGIPVTETFPPTKAGTPKQRKAAMLLGPSPITQISRLSFVDDVPSLQASPMKSNASPMKVNSPRRRKLGGAKKGVILTPRKKSPVKGKRGVRWKDDTEEGPLAEYEATPQNNYSSNTPEISSGELPPPTFSAPFASVQQSHGNSSPLLPPPEYPPAVTLDAKPRPNRFQAGFLSKKNDGSPLGPPPTSSVLQYSSDSDSTSPLRELDINKVPSMSSLRAVRNAEGSSDVTPADSVGSASSEDEAQLRPGSKDSAATVVPKRLSPPTMSAERPSSSNGPTRDGGWGQHTLDAADAKMVRTALKHSRRASVASGSLANNHTANASAMAGGLGQNNHSAARAHRRRSPTASGSPPSMLEYSLTSGQARRMGSTSNDNVWSRTSVLSPRTGPIAKLNGGGSIRRTTMQDTPGSGSVPGSAVRVGAGAGVGTVGGVRLSAAAMAAINGRGSLAGGAKAVWR